MSFKIPETWAVAILAVAKAAGVVRPVSTDNAAIIAMSLCISVFANQDNE